MECVGLSFFLVTRWREKVSQEQSFSSYFKPSRVAKNVSAENHRKLQVEIQDIQLNVDFR